METIEELARETLGEIYQLVRASPRGRLRHGSQVEPPPGLAALEALAERHRTSGLAVDVEIEGSRRHLSQAVDRAAYRILQEALTNAAGHGRGCAEVEVAFGRRRWTHGDESVPPATQLRPTATALSACASGWSRSAAASRRSAAAGPFGSERISRTMAANGSWL